MANRAVIVQTGGGYNRVVMERREAADPGQGEITVRLHANSLNYHDFAVVSGLWGPAEPRIPMADGAGEVVAVGPGVTELALGDAVVSTFFPEWEAGEAKVEGFATVPGDGIDGYAREMVTVPARNFTRAPRGWSHSEASTLTTAALTAWRSLMADDHLKPGDTVLVQGTGGVSIFALQFAKMAGATVIATTSREEKVERLRNLGADHVLNYRLQPQWGSLARELTGGRGVDHVLDVGGPDTLEQSMAAARVGGHLSVIGILSGVQGTFNFIPALIKQLRLQGVLVGSRSHQEAMIRAIDAGGLRPVIDRVYPLEEIVAAFQYQASNDHFGKICLEM